MKSTFPLLICIGGVLLTGLQACSETDAKDDQLPQTNSVAMPTTINRVLGVGRIEPQNGILKLTAGTDGKIVEILMQENGQVQKGQVLINFEVEIENAQLTQAQSKLSTQRAVISSSKSTLEALQVNLQQAITTYSRNQKLFEYKAQTRQALEESKSQVEGLTKEVEAATAALSEATNRLKELVADVEYYRTLVNQKQLKAPTAGKILKIDGNTGDYVSNATEVAQFAPAGLIVAKTEVDELYAERVKNGQKAYIFSQTTGDTLATGRVSFTADYYKQKSLFKDQSTELEDRRVREVHIQLEAGNTPLIGSRVDCLIVL